MPEMNGLMDDVNAVSHSLAHSTYTLPASTELRQLGLLSASTHCELNSSC